LTGTIAAFAHWAERHMDAVLAAHAPFDAAAEASSEPAAGSVVHRLR
jgi:hypothetical protein